MIQKILILSGLMGMVVFTAGCKTSRLEKDYGNSLRLAKSNQILNPEAVENLEPVYGFDGQAAEIVIGKYRKDFEKPPAAPVYPLGTTISGMRTR